MRTSKSKIGAFLRTVLPPLLARSVPKFLRLIKAVPAVRAVMIVVLVAALAFLLVPAFFTFLLVWLATGDMGAAGAGGLIVMALSATALIAIGIRLRGQWRRFRRRNFDRYLN